MFFLTLIDNLLMVFHKQAVETLSQLLQVALLVQVTLPTTLMVLTAPGTLL